MSEEQVRKGEILRLLNLNNIRKNLYYPVLSYSYYDFSLL